MKKSDQPKQPEEEKQNDRVKQLEEELTTITNNWKRALADYQNLEKRTNEEKRAFAQFAARELVLKLLPNIDLLELAQKHAKEDKGLELIIANFQKVLSDEGLVRIQTVGKHFDPHTMECIQSVPGEKDEEVIEEVRAGYLLKDTVIRPAQVKISIIKEERKESA